LVLLVTSALFAAHTDDNKTSALIDELNQIPVFRGFYEALTSDEGQIGRLVTAYINGKYIVMTNLGDLQTIADHATSLRFGDKEFMVLKSQSNEGPLMIFGALSELRKEYGDRIGIFNPEHNRNGTGFNSFFKLLEDDNPGQFEPFIDCMHYYYQDGTYKSLRFSDFLAYRTQSHLGATKL
jgi:hypothetical protein